MNILQINTKDIGGGAEKIAFTLHQNYRDQGHQSWLAVGQKILTDPEILLIPNNNFRNPWSKFWNDLGSPLLPFARESKIAAKLHGLLTRGIADPPRWWKRQLGQDDFEFPATKHLLKLPSNKPNLIHCHNLHGEYFNLAALPYLSKQVPMFLTLHDAWLLSGHCAHSFECERWKIGCGECPDLTIPPAIKQDSSAYNWQQKLKIYQQSKLYIATPSRWLMNKVEDSILTQGMVEGRVISNGINLENFYSTDKKRVRQNLGIPNEAKVILFTANGIRKNRWKDYKTMRKAVEQVAAELQEEQIIFIALGENGPSEKIGKAIIQFIPYQKDPKSVAQYYQAVDIYVHAAKADTFPNTILEALACGTPVIGTAVGGIPEQIEDAKTGFLVSVGDSGGIAEAMIKILKNDHLHQFMRKNAVQTAQEKYSLHQMVKNYLEWYQEILDAK